ncbi:MAG: protein kinase [Anaerolineae bacterium]
MNNLIGQHLGPYRILEQIGIGGMATVYKAYQPAMDRYVAIKVIAAHFAQDETFLRRFRREAKAVAQLEHAHILPVHDFGEADGRPYLVMRFLEAGTLKDRMAQGPLPLTEVNRIVGQVGSALDYAHRMGVIHRDVKPTNVLLDAEGDAFLTDFGLARMMEASVQLTETGVGIGTPAYMSPEQGKGAKVDSRSDVYSLGVMLYEMVTGRAPYEAETPLAVVLKHIQEPLPLPRSIRPEVPEEVERVILRAMAKEPEDRYQTAGEMVRALDAAVRAAEAAARTEPAVAEVAAEPAVAPAVPRPRARKLRLPRWAGWAAGGAVALAAFFLILSRVPLRVQISGGQLEVVRVVEGTPVPSEAAEGAEGATPIPTRMPTPTEAPSTAMPPAEAALRWEQLADAYASTFLPVAFNALAVDPNDPDTIFAGTSGAGIYVSHDGGQTWAPGNEGLGKGTVGSILVDPSDSNVVYAALSDQGGVYKSTDGGQTWTAANRGINLDNAWNWTGLLYLDPRDSSRLYYSGTTDGLYHSGDGGATWQQRGGECPSITGLAIDPNDRQHLYAAGYQHPGSECLAGVYESTDGGQSWRRLSTEEMLAPGDEFGGDWFHLAADPQDFSILYAGGQRGIYKTSDGGQSWTPILDQGCEWLVTSEVALYCGRGGDLLISPDGGESWAEASYGAGWGGQEMQPLVVTPGDPQILYAGADAVMRSTDGGWTWTRVGSLGAMARMHLTVDPRDGERLFLSGVDYVNEVFRSEDGGETWQVVSTNGGWRSRITIDPAQNVIYLPSPSGGLYCSRDDGRTWESFGSGYLTHGPWQLVPDPQDAAKLWLVGECGTRLSLSEDGGETFEMVESFPQDICMPTLLVHGEGRRMYVVDWGNFHRSDDGGETWASPGGLGGIYRAAALDPSNPDVVYVGSTHKGVLKTENGGISWRQINTGLTNPSINELAIDPANPQTIYAATDGGAFVSTDGGENWSPIQVELGPNPIVYSIAVDPNDSSKVYAVTPDGVFRLVGAPPVDEATSAPTPVPGSMADQARTFAEPILAAIAARPPDFEDDFSDPGSGWAIGSTDQSETGYQDGEYFIIANPPSPGVECNCDGVGAVPQVSDFVLEIDGRFISGEMGDWQVKFREGDEGYYVVLLSSEGYLDLWKSEAEEVKLFTLRGPPIGSGDETNRLQVMAKGPWIALYLNGEPIYLAYDETFSTDGIDLTLCNHGANPVRVHFDNFRVWDITDLALPTSATVEQARAFAEPILAAIAARSPDFEDDFSDPGSGWNIGTQSREETGWEEGEAGYADGEYFIVAAPAYSPEDTGRVTCSSGQHRGRGR